jgi:hypothetical protein
MTRKICSFKELPNVVPPQFNKVDNTVTDDVDQLGDINNVFFFSFDDANNEVVADEASEFKIFDFTNEDDAAEFKQIAGKLIYIAQKLDEIEAKLFKSSSLYAAIKGALEDSQELTSKIQEIETEKDEFLQSLGIPGQAAI